MSTGGAAKFPQRVSWQHQVGLLLQTVHHWPSLSVVTLEPPVHSAVNLASQGVRSDGHVPWWLASVSTSCFRQNHTTLSSEGELCTYLSGVICKKQMFGIITYFSQNQGQFRFLRPFLKYALCWYSLDLTQKWAPVGTTSQLLTGRSSE